MTKEEILDLYNSQKITIIHHVPLVVLSCAAWNENETDNDYWNDEFIFTVPIEWLIDYMNKWSEYWKTNEKWDWEKVQTWLQNEYTSEDSQPIFEQAVQDNVCVTLNF